MDKKTHAYQKEKTYILNLNFFQLIVANQKAFGRFELKEQNHLIKYAFLRTYCRLSKRYRQIELSLRHCHCSPI